MDGYYNSNNKDAICWTYTQKRVSLLSSLIGIGIGIGIEMNLLTRIDPCFYRFSIIGMIHLLYREWDIHNWVGYLFFVVAIWFL